MATDKDVQIAFPVVNKRRGGDVTIYYPDQNVNIAAASDAGHGGQEVAPVAGARGEGGDSTNVSATVRGGQVAASVTNRRGGGDIITHPPGPKCKYCSCFSGKMWRLGSCTCSWFRKEGGDLNAVTTIGRCGHVSVLPPMKGEGVM